MTRNPPKHRTSPQPPAGRDRRDERAAPSRAERLALALRQNLARRKAQGRARGRGAGDDGAGDG